MIIRTLDTNKKLFQTLMDLGVHFGEHTKTGFYSKQLIAYTLGSRNSFFIIDIQKTLYYLKRAMSFFSLLAKDNLNVLFYHSHINTLSNLKSIFYYIILHKSNNSFMGYKWAPGIVNNYLNSFLKLMYILLKVNFINSNSTFSLTKTLFYSDASGRYRFLRYLLLKILYLTFEQTLLKLRNWNKNYKVVLKFWKLFIFFRTFRTFFNTPDCLFIINPSNNWVPIREFSKGKYLPVVGLVDTLHQDGVTYPIPSNDDSLPLSLFYISLFCNIFLLEKYKYYKYINS